MKNKKCILCGKELDDTEKDLCDSCYGFLKIKYPKNKLGEVIKCHKKQAKKLNR